MGEYTVIVLVRDQLQHLPGSGVVLRPHADEFIKVMRPQNGSVPGQVFKVVHDDSNKEIQHLVNEDSV